MIPRMTYDYKRMHLRMYRSTIERRMFVEQNANVQLDLVGKAHVNEEKDIHCENLIGAISIPLGVAGPLLMKGELVHKEVMVPLATTEGALVASVSRGAKVISQAGGVTTLIQSVGTTRGPVFETLGIQESNALIMWVRSHQDELKKEAESTSSHLKLVDIDATMQGKYVYLRIRFDTDQAMGMNMVTIATDAIGTYIETHTNTRCIAVAGNYDTDKKPAWINMIQGRGIKCFAEVHIPANLVKEHFKVTVSDLVHTTFVKCWGGSALSGSLGFNAHFANIVAALFLATGQDAAHVVEGSLGTTIAEVEQNGDLYFSVTLPDIMIGVVGGGTKLGTQKEAISIMGVTQKEELAEVLAGAVLAGELSLMASITERTLGASHKRLGR